MHRGKAVLLCPIHSPSCQRSQDFYTMRMRNVWDMGWLFHSGRKQAIKEEELVWKWEAKKMRRFGECFEEGVLFMFRLSSLPSHSLRLQEQHDSPSSSNNTPPPHLLHQYCYVLYNSTSYTVKGISRNHLQYANTLPLIGEAWTLKISVSKGQCICRSVTRAEGPGALSEEWEGQLPNAAGLCYYILKWGNTSNIWKASPPRPIRPLSQSLTFPKCTAGYMTRRQWRPAEGLCWISYMADDYLTLSPPYTATSNKETRKTSLSEP